MEAYKEPVKTADFVHVNFFKQAPPDRPTDGTENILPPDGIVRSHLVETPDQIEYMTIAPTEQQLGNISLANEVQA